MDKLPSKNPLVLHIVDANLAADNPFPIEQTIILAGDVPENIRKALQNKNEALLREFYGKERSSALLQLLASGGASGGGGGGAAKTEVEFNELDDFFDISELKEDQAKPPARSARTSRAARAARTDRADRAERAEAAEAEAVEAKATKVSHMSVFPEDRISELKEKIYVETGIPPYKQYLCVKFNENYIPMYYHIIANGMINVDIQKSVHISTKILGIPVDTNFFNDKDQMLVEAGDMFFTVQDVQNAFRTSTFYLFNIDSIVGPSKRILDEMVRTEPDQIELLYYGFVVKYWPMMTYSIFLQYLSDEKLIQKSYPDLSPATDKLRSKIHSESEVLNAKYQLLYSDNPAVSKKMSLYSPQVGEFGKPSPGSIIDTAIKSATMIVKERSWETNRVGLEFSGKTRMNMRNLFYHSHVSDDVPIIRVRLLVSNQLVTITKILSPTFSTADHAKVKTDIKHVYDLMRSRINLPYYNAIMFVVRLPGPETRFVNVTIRDSGRYEIKSVWNENDKVNFKMLMSSISSSINPHITHINSMGRTVFQGGMQLSLIEDTTVTFSDLNMALFWKKTLTASEFAHIVTNLKKRLPAEIIKFTENPESVLGVIQYMLIKGMTQESLVGMYKNLQVSNYYEYLSDAKVKQQWYQLFSIGRGVVITHRTTDVKIDVENLKEKEFKYFYDHIITMLFETDSLSSAAKSKKVSKPGSAKKEHLGKGANLLKLLKGRDPELFNFKKYGSDTVYSRKCQKDHQPIPYSTEEYEALGKETKSRAVKFWNFTSETPMYYVCPNSKFPHMSFIVGQHPKGYCLPCCKKTPTYEHEVTTGKHTKKENIYETCMKHYSYVDADTDIGPSRYIMNYGKSIDMGRVGKLPDAIDKWILYNMEEDIMVRSRYDDTSHFAGKEYSTKKLWKVTKNNKVRLIPVSTLALQLEQKSWSNARPGKKSGNVVEYTPKEIMENTNRSPDHYNRVLNVDTSFPIIVHRNISEGWQVVLDGLHRLAKAVYIDKDEMIAVKYVTNNQLSKSEIREKQIKDVGRKLMIKKALKKPGYYLFGISQNSSYVDNVGAVYAIATSMGKSVPQYISEVVDILKNSNIYLSLLNGHIIKYFKNKSELINSLLVLFSETTKGVANNKFDKWNELFIDLTRLCYNVYVIILEDVNGQVNLSLPIKINSVDDIFPQRTKINAESDITVEYIYLLKRSKKSRSLYSSSNLYYPIFVITPQEFFKNMSIDKRMYNQNDEIVNLSRTMVNQVFSGLLEDRIEKEFNLKAVLAYVQSASTTSAADGRIKSLYVNTKGICYAVALPGSGGSGGSGGNVIIPIKYSSVDNIPSKYFANEKKKLVHDPVSSFTANTPKAMKEFITSYNSFVVEISEAKGMTTSSHAHTDSRAHALNKKEVNISPIFPLIKIESILVSIVGKTKDHVIGFVSNGLRYYMSATMTRSEFYKYMSSGYNAFSEKIESDGDVEVYYVHYDPTVMNKIIYDYQSSERKDKTDRDPNMQDISKVIYEKHMYYLYTSELMAYLDRERNTTLRKKIVNSITSEDLRGKSESVYQSLRALLLPDYPEDMERIDEILSRYYTSHYDRKTLMHELEHMTYQFDRITLMQLKSASEYFYGFNKEQREHKMQEIRKIVKGISDNFVTKKAPNFKVGSSGTPDLYMAECKSNLGKSVPYCDRGKLLIPGKKLEDFIEIFSEEVVNPLRRDYILSAVYISEIIDVYKFPKVPGEELYVKFG